MSGPNDSEEQDARDAEAEDEAEVATPVLAYHLDGARIPLFFIRTWFNELRAYERLARRLGPDQPIYTIAPPRGTTRAEMPPTAEAWADFCLERIRETGYDGPYLVGGWSFGGVVALELARTLRAGGADVRRVLMIDAWRPRHRATNRGRLGMLILHLNRMAELDTAARRAYVRKRIARTLAKIRARGRPDEGATVEKDGYGVEHVITNQGTRMSLLRRAVWVAHWKYMSPRSDLPVSLYWSPGSRDAHKDCTLGWIPTLCGDLECVGIAGDHFTVFEEPHVAILAQRIARTLDTYAPERRALTAPRTSTYVSTSEGPR